MTLQPKLIALCGHKGVGKSTYASFLAGKTGHVFSFATPLKSMLTAVFPNEYVLKKKDEKIPYFDVTARYLLQTLGTEWGREMVDQNIWIKLLRVRLIECLTDSAVTPLVVDDLRFDNEAEMIRELGGEVWHLDRRSFTAGHDDHVSEQGISDKLITKKVLL
jgi:energy-coupling factor transporter ATP-binding protein EcfA2